MAVDQLGARTGSLEQLRWERDTLRARIGDGPTDPSREWRQLTETLARETDYKANAQWRLDTARTSLDQLGPIGRRTHRAERREYERRITNFKDEITRHDQKLADLENQLGQLTPAVRTRSGWEDEHSTELDRLASLDRQIDRGQQLERTASRERDRGMERDLGIEL